QNRGTPDRATRRRRSRAVRRLECPAKRASPPWRFGLLLWSVGLCRVVSCSVLLRQARCSHKPGAPATGSRRWRSGLVWLFHAEVIRYSTSSHHPDNGQWTMSTSPTTILDESLRARSQAAALTPN